MRYGWANLCVISGAQRVDQGWGCVTNPKCGFGRGPQRPAVMRRDVKDLIYQCSFYYSYQFSDPNRNHFLLCSICSHCSTYWVLNDAGPWICRVCLYCGGMGIHTLINIQKVNLVNSKFWLAALGIPTEVFRLCLLQVLVHMFTRAGSLWAWEATTAVADLWLKLDRSVVPKVAKSWCSFLFYVERNIQHTCILCTLLR